MDSIHAFANKNHIDGYWTIGICRAPVLPGDPRGLNKSDKTRLINHIEFAGTWIRLRGLTYGKVRTGTYEGYVLRLRRKTTKGISKRELYEV